MSAVPGHRDGDRADRGGSGDGHARIHGFTGDGTRGGAADLAHCLEKEPARRFQSAHDLGFALPQACTQSAGHSPVRAAPEARGPWAFRAAPAVLLLAAGVAGARWLWRDPTPAQWSGVLLGGPEISICPRLASDGHLLAFQALLALLHEKLARPRREKLMRRCRGEN